MALFHLEANGGGFVPPSTADFNLPPVFGNNQYTTKPILLVFLSVIVISIFFILDGIPFKLLHKNQMVQ